MYPRQRSRSCLAPLVVTLSVLSVSSVSAVAYAGSSQDAAAADALFQRGKEAMAKGDLATACAALAESQRLDPAVGTLLNLADCEERAGKLASATAHFQEARDKLPAGDYRIPFAETRMASLGPRLPKLAVVPARGLPAGAVVLRDEAVLGPASFGVALPVDPGVHIATLRTPGHADARVEIALREGETKTVELTPGARLLASRGDDASPGATSGRTQRVVGLALGGAGIAGLALGTVFGLVSKSTYDGALRDCPTGPTSCNDAGVTAGADAHTQATISTVAFVAGGLLAAGGATLYLTAPKSDRVGLRASVTGSGLGVGGVW
jgi:hypothetical protein